MQPAKQLNIKSNILKVVCLQATQSNNKTNKYMNITTDKEILKDLFIAECSDVYTSEVYINAYTDYIRFVAYEPASECKDGTYWNEKTGSFERSKAIVTITKVLGDVELNWGEKHFPCIEAAKNAILTIELSDMAGLLNKLI